ncbi:hypothetical protein GRI62_04600 [Erythrobacter arachoides]|uniref:PepSY domain-containing protein n=1 Tax=Aurantiacibacter arachoides TaxID=1850444 RepID=A0A845A1Q6_9SPHN|nr:hypothetical protein [Aurantiacibacter arachoides]MXO92887.1 hypothetical protein [Aurantiacibacter arachoides]GGD53694.1 hypothetical protein GCM10011411_12000 [Aurantiacibacter arachoides]
MNTRVALLAAMAFAASLSANPAQAQDRGDQANARAEMAAGRIMPIRDIERRIIPQMRSGDEYIGFEYDSTAQAYRLKFIRNGRMIWVDVDAQSARVLRVSR